MRVVLVQPPRRYWPYISEGDNFLLPQALPVLAAPLRDAGVEVRIIDCMPLRIGWRSLADILRRLDPDVVGCGENHALYASEALRFFQLCKEVVPRAVTVAGGAHFTNLWKMYLGPRAMSPRCDIDVVVIGEGERSLLDLCAELATPLPDLDRVLGIAFRRDGEIRRTPPRPLIADLDAQPLPAYDLVPMDLYGRSRYLFSPGGTTIHHSRGCTGHCSFCAWWTTMAERSYDETGKVHLKPRWRTRSAERVMEEVEILYHRHGKRALVWVDESWNLDPQFNDRFAEAMIRADLRMKWFAFVRADALVRDEKLGILEKLVRAGLSHVCVGVERAADDDLASFDKPFYKGGVAEQAIGILKHRYPQVFLQATFIVGVDGESHESLQRQVALARRLDVDFPAFHPVTPVAGSRLFDEALAKGLISEADFEDYDWMTPILDTRHMTRDELADALYHLNEVFVNPRWLAKGLLSRVPYRRDMYTWFALVSARMALDTLKQRLNPFKPETYHRLVTPGWYET